MKTALTILLLLLGWLLPAAPLPPPPARTAGGPVTTQISFTNANHEVITITSRISTVPDPARSPANKLRSENLVAPAAKPAIPAPVAGKRIWLFAAFGMLIICLVRAIFREK